MTVKSEEKIRHLTELFRAAGARDPEGWARSEIEEDIPQLARFLFLRGAWRCVVADDDTSWVEAYRQPPKQPDAPLAAASAALNRLMDKGIDPRDLTEVVRTMQYELLHSICYFLGDPTWATEGLDETPAELTGVGWALFEVDEQDRVGRPIGGLHESLLETDPTGREMRPRKP